MYVIIELEPIIYRLFHYDCCYKIFFYVYPWPNYRRSQGHLRPIVLVGPKVIYDLVIVGPKVIYDLVIVGPKVIYDL